MTDPATTEVASAQESPMKFSAGERITLVVMLFFVSVSSYMDRFVLSILQEPIKLEFGLSDTQLGLMTGTAFVVLYSLLGIPIAQWADRGNRRTIMTVCIATWSVMTAACGLAQSYVQLLLARIGVGIGEAGTLPPSHSLIGDYFPPEGRSTALAMLTFGSSTGIALGTWLGGAIGAEFGWRVAFLAVGLPGVLLAVAVRLVIKEPRTMGGTPWVPPRKSPLDYSAIPELLRKRPYVHLVAAMSVYYLVVGGALGFLPPHFSRALGVGLADIGFYYGWSTAIAAAIGTLSGGPLADYLSRRDPRWMLYIPAIAMIVVLPLFIGMLLADNFFVAIGFYFVAWIVLAAGYPPIFAAVQGIAGAGSRAMAVAVLFLASILVGYGIGPVAVGALSDFLAPSVGVDSLRYAMMCALMLLIWVSFHFWRASKTFMNHFEAANSD